MMDGTNGPNWMARMGRDPLYALRSPRDRARRCDAIRLTPYGDTLRAGKSATAKLTHQVMIEKFCNHA